MQASFNVQINDIGNHADVLIKVLYCRKRRYLVNVILHGMRQLVSAVCRSWIGQV